MNILLAVCGGIATYKAVDLASACLKNGHVVQAIMTDHATAFIPPATVAVITHRPVYVTEWAEPERILHIELARWAELFLLCPATANSLGKLAHGIADDLVSTTYLALGTQHIQRLLFPAMNTYMWAHPAVRRNLDQLRSDGCLICLPGTGQLACGEDGPGKLRPTRELYAWICENCTP